MSDLAEHLADLTGYRDREALDVSLVTALKDLLQPVSVSVYRSVGEPDDLRWLLRGHIRTGDLVASADPLRSEIDRLPKLASAPARLQARDSQRLVMLPGPTHIACFPLATDREVVGVVEVETRTAMQMPTQRLVSTVLRIYRNFQSLLDESEHDTLTGLLNRKAFDDSFAKLTPRQLHAPGPVPADERRDGVLPDSHWLGLIHIDDFEHVTRQHGRPAGDELVLLLSRMMRGSFRLQDRLYRYGGEEFVVLMRCGGEADAALALDRLRAAVAAYRFPQVQDVRISVGCTEIRDGDTPGSAIERADLAIRDAPADGRDSAADPAEPR